MKKQTKKVSTANEAEVLEELENMEKESFEVNNLKIINFFHWIDPLIMIQSKNLNDQEIYFEVSTTHFIEEMTRCKAKSATFRKVMPKVEKYLIFEGFNF